MNTPFLTDLDSRAEVKGSRDPLGLMAIWARFGRGVVANLTTVTSNVRGFTTLLLGLYYAEKVQEIERGDAPSLLETFLKFEQLAGYARVKRSANAQVRGWRLAKRRLGESKRIRISAAPPNQILSNQKVYGLWGLFSMPARASNLLMEREQKLTPNARAFVEEHYVPRLGSITDQLRRKEFDFEPDGKLAESLANVHGALSPAEKVFYREHLARPDDGRATGGRQRLLAELLAKHDSEEFDYKDFHAIRNRAARHRDGDLLAASLDRIDTLERLINPARVAFNYLLTQNEQTVADVAANIRRVWETPPKILTALLPAIEADIAAASWLEAAKRWMEIANVLTRADYQTLIQKLVEANTDVMQKRNGSAGWLTIESGRLRVRMAEETENLLPPSEVERLWRSTYFINSLWAVAREVSDAS